MDLVNRTRIADPSLEAVAYDRNVLPSEIRYEIWLKGVSVDWGTRGPEHACWSA